MASCVDRRRELVSRIRGWIEPGALSFLLRSRRFLATHEEERGRERGEKKPSVREKVTDRSR